MDDQQCTGLRIKISWVKSNDACNDGSYGWSKSCLPAQWYGLTSEDWSRTTRSRQATLTCGSVCVFGRSTHEEKPDNKREANKKPINATVDDEVSKSKERLHCISKAILTKLKFILGAVDNSQSKMRLYCSKNKDEYKQSDRIKARSHTLLDFLHLSRNRCTFFLQWGLKDRNVALNLMATNTRSPRQVVESPAPKKHAISACMIYWNYIKIVIRASLTKCGARLEALFRDPTLWREQKFWGGASSHNQKSWVMWKSEARKR